MTWFKTYRAESPNINKRMNGLVIDLTTDIDKSALDAKTEAVNAVNKIVNSLPAPYSLLVSGGVDSQVMILAWKNSGHKFKIFHYSYNDLNSHDSATLAEFAALHNISYEVISFDAMSFIQSDELSTYAKKYDCSSPQILTYIKLAEMHQETVIMAGNYYSDNTIGLNFTILALQRFADSDKNNFVPFFLSYTPELTFAFAKIDMGIKCEQARATHEIDHYAAKYKSYLSAGFEIVAQPAKYTGFEQIKNQFDSMQVESKLKLQFSTNKSKRPFDLKFRYALYNLIGAYSEQTIHIL